MLKKIVLEGNIGSGKSTILNELSIPINKQFEPVEKFTLLESYYKDPFRYANDLQVQVANVHLEVENALNQPTVFERTIETSIHIFSSMAYDDNMISKSQFENLKVKLNESVPVHAFIYIDVDLDNCMERISRRGRPGEENIKKAYLGKLKSKMDILFEIYNNKGIPCLRINNATGHLDHAVKEIETFLTSLEVN
jgi:deoxyadenosine/deoxycytidine kinase